MIQKIFLAAVSCLPLVVCAQKGFTIHGKVGSLNAPAKAIMIYYDDDGKLMKDSVLLHEGQFSFSGNLNSPVEADITIKHDAIERPAEVREDAISFFIENSDITITAQDSIKYGTVKGSSTNEDNRTLLMIQRPYRRDANSIIKRFQERTPEQRADTTGLAALRAMMQANQEGYDSVTRVFIYSHLNSYVSLSSFKEIELKYNFNPDTAAVKFARFTKSQRESVYGKKLEEMIDNVKNTAIGRTAPDFTETDSTGKPVSLSDFRGHYVLLDFWASWCAPCRAENPNYLKAYDKYKDKNFTILGVSLDDANARLGWLAAVKFDKLPWKQIAALKGFHTESARLYAIKQIPSNFLIDPTGKIIGKNLRGEDLDKKLSQLFSM